MNIDAKLEAVFESCQRLNRGIDDDLYSKLTAIAEQLAELKEIGRKEFNNQEYKGILGAYSAIRNARTFFHGMMHSDAFAQIWAATELLHQTLSSYQRIDLSDAPTLEVPLTDVKEIIAQQSVGYGLR